jgi:hypothetical protein
MEADPYHLINAAAESNAVEILLNPGEYKGISFLLGIDSISNCSGAQTGALDPTNDMFWTWNTGYVIFKLEGTSTASTSDLQRIEHHIGGYKESDNVTKKIQLAFPTPLTIKENGSAELMIEMNLDHYWNAVTNIKISETSVCMSPGPVAKKMAQNFNSLFSIKQMN